MEELILLVIVAIYLATVIGWLRIYKRAKYHLFARPRTWIESRVKDMVLLAIIFWPVLNLFILVGIYYDFRQDSLEKRIL